MVLARLSDGGYIIADNTLWDGHVLEEHPHGKDLQTIGIKAFNDLVAHDKRVEKVILPLRDGLTIIKNCKHSVRVIYLCTFVPEIKEFNVWRQPVRTK